LRLRSLVVLAHSALVPPARQRWLKWHLHKLSTVPPLSNTALVIVSKYSFNNCATRSDRNEFASWVKPTMSINKIVIKRVWMQIQYQFALRCLVHQCGRQKRFSTDSLGKYSAPLCSFAFKASKFRTSAFNSRSLKVWQIRIRSAFCPGFPHQFSPSVQNNRCPLLLLRISSIISRPEGRHHQVRLTKSGKWVCAIRNPSAPLQAVWT